MMTSTSKSNQGIADHLNFVSKPKKRAQVMHSTPNWLELPSDVTANILYRVGVFNIIENAQKVCTIWCQICKDPAMWRVIHVDRSSNPHATLSYYDIINQALNRSQGQLVDITIVHNEYDDLLLLIADSSTQLRRLNIASCYGELDETWTIALKKFPLLEELSLYSTEITKEAIEAAGRYCPLLKTLKVNSAANIFISDESSDEIAIAIGKNLIELRDLELIGSSMSNIGLQAILDGCCHLESLDLRNCLCINLKGTMGKRCLEQIKYLKRPNDSLKGCPYMYVNESLTYDRQSVLYSDYSDEESDGFFYSDEESNGFFYSDEESDGFFYSDEESDGFIYSDEDSEGFVDFDNSTDHHDEDDDYNDDGGNDDDFTNF